MTGLLRILVIEDDLADYLLAMRILARDGLVVESRRVDRASQLRAALAETTWDAVLADYAVPGLPFRQALALVQEAPGELPVLLFSGSIGEEEAVALVKLGVRDFILKDRPRRLPSALRNALEKAHARTSEREGLEALAASESEARKWIGAFMACAHGIALIETCTGTFLACNPAFALMLGRTMEGVLGSGLVAAFEPASRLVLSGHRAEAERLGRCTFEAEMLREDGTAFPVQVHLVRQPDPSGHGVHQVATVQDLTEIRAVREEERRLERELTHLQKLESIGRLAGGVSHDINNVLAAVMAMASVLRVKGREVPEVAEGAAAILGAAIRGRDLVKALTDFARKDHGKAVPLDLNALVLKEVDLLERTTFRKVDIQVRLQEPLPRILGDASALANALMNLCVNACDAMPEGGSLTLSTALLADGRLEMAVTDTGAGMTPEVAARALEPFFTTKALGKGTGLGLAIVLGTAKVHGGTLELQSGPGQGTRAALLLPPMVVAAPPAPAKAQRAPCPSMRVLLVDDDALIRQAVPPLLTFMGHWVDTAAGGRDALLRLEGGLAVDLVILDINMPGMDGVETLKRLRVLRPELRVLLATGFMDERLPGVLARDPRVRILHKPFLMDDLEEALALG